MLLLLLLWLMDWMRRDVYATAAEAEWQEITAGDWHQVAIYCEVLVQRK